MSETSILERFLSSSPEGARFGEAEVQRIAEERVAAAARCDQTLAALAKERPALQSENDEARDALAVARQSLETADRHEHDTRARLMQNGFAAEAARKRRAATLLESTPPEIAEFTRWCVRAESRTRQGDGPRVIAELTALRAAREAAAVLHVDPASPVEILAKLAELRTELEKTVQFTTAA